METKEARRTWVWKIEATLTSLQWKQWKAAIRRCKKHYQSWKRAREAACKDHWQWWWSITRGGRRFYSSQGDRYWRILGYVSWWGEKTCACGSTLHTLNVRDSNPNKSSLKYFIDVYCPELASAFQFTENPRMTRCRACGARHEVGTECPNKIAHVA